MGSMISMYLDYGLMMAATCFGCNAAIIRPK